MAALVRDRGPIELQQLREYRKQHGLDHYDEMWDGVLHMNPPPTTEHQYVVQEVAELLSPLARESGLFPLIQVFGVGEGRDSYRVPDGGLFRSQPHGVWQGTAALVIEVVSADDETWAKLEFYAVHEIDELLIIDHEKRTVEWLGLINGKYEAIGRSSLIDLGPGQLSEQIAWP
jgi:Uma2 family endonuclease